jgi:hypothetical protein
MVKRRRAIMRQWWLIVLLSLLMGCSDDESDRGVVGPAVEVNCAQQTRTAQARNPGIGDTDVRVECPGAI